MLGSSNRYLVLLPFLAFGLWFSFQVGKGTEQQNERIRIEAAKHPNNAVQEQTRAQQGQASTNAPSNPHTENGSNDRAEWNFPFGLRPGEVMLVLFTVLLWLSTADIADTAKDTAQRQLRAYVSGGGWRARVEREGPIGVRHHPLAHVIETETVPVRWRIIEPLDSFDIHINNHGQTPARLHHIRFGFFDAAAPIPDIPPYGDLIVQVDAIGSPRNQSKFVRRVDYPAARWPRMAICGRFYWTDVLDREWSSGFVYEIASGNAEQNDSISIEAPSVYREDRREPDPR
jgi:hypothetical protein